MQILVDQTGKNQTFFGQKRAKIKRFSGKNGQKSNVDSVSTFDANLKAALLKKKFDII